MKHFLLSMYLMALCPWALCAATDYMDIVKTINMKSLQHPYLVFDNNSKKEILKLVESDAKAAEIMKMIQVEGQRYMLTTPDVEPKYIAEELHAQFFDGVNPYMQYRYYFMHGAQTLAFLYQMYGDEGYAQKAYYLIDKICALDTWIHKAHDFDNIYGRVWPWGAKDDQVVFSYDHSNGHYGVEMSFVYDWLYPALTKYQRDRLRGAMLEKVITKVRGNYEYHWWATAYRCNWSGICHSGAGMSALALLTEDPQLIDVVARACEGVDGMISQIGIDGGWAEGRGYWAYGFGVSACFMDAVKRVTNGEINLFNLPGIKNTPTDFALFAMGGPFCDGGSIGTVGSIPLHNKLIAETKNETGMWYLENIHNPANPTDGNYWNLIWPSPKDVKAVKPKEASKHFRTIDWAFMRKDFGNEYMQLAVKSGSNGDPHHGFLDIGSVALTWQGESVIGKFAAGNYERYVFHEMRWTYLHTSSYGQNVVIVNGEQQEIEKHKDQPWSDHFIGGKIEQFVVRDNYAYTLVDATKAYPGKELKGWKRWAILDKEHNMVILLDEVKCVRGAEIDVLFHPNVEAKLSGTAMSLKGAHTDMEMQTLFKGKYILETGRQLHHQIILQNATHRIPYFHTLIEKAPAETNYIASIFYPTALKSDARFSMDESGRTPVITCVINGKTMQYTVAANDVTLTIR